MSNIISADVPDDLKERIEAAREGKGDGKESRSSALKRLIRAGLDAEGGHTIPRFRFPLYAAFPIIMYVTPPPPGPWDMALWGIAVAMLLVAAVGELRN